MVVILGHFLNGIAAVIGLVIDLYIILIIIRAIISWVDADPYNTIVHFIHTVTEPVLYRIRTHLPVVFGGMDLSPMLLILVLVFLDSFIVGSLRSVAAAMIM